jgi:hypothetical protein
LTTFGEIMTLLGRLEEKSGPIISKLFAGDLGRGIGMNSDGLLYSLSR